MTLVRASFQFVSAPRAKRVAPRSVGVPGVAGHGQGAADVNATTVTILLETSQSPPVPIESPPSAIT